MLLILPTVSNELGPAWASELNAALTLVDSHDHTAGKGTKISPAGFVVNANMDFLTYAIQNLKGAYLYDQGGTLDSSQHAVIYQNAGNLYYNNASGVPVQITSGNFLVNLATSAIVSSIISSYPYTVLASDAQKVLLIDTASARTINLPAATTNMFFMLKDRVGSAQTNNISVVPNGTDTVEGSTSYILNTNMGAWGFVSDGVSRWYLV